ncbi:MAG: B12-binding domain-containing radical SAM protein [Desulfobacterales bacterium]|nr:B12-binding domain-containing radical SAM protein [Desulfobacterales bacterium]
MKIILLQPPIQDFYDTDIRLQPLGLCMLKAVVRRASPEVDVKVMDFHHGQGKRQIPLPPEFSYLREYYAFPDSGPFSTFHRYMHFGAPFEEVGRQVAAEAPSLVGISSLFSPYHREAAACAREIKQRIGAPIVMGGPHVSACPKEVLSDPNVDFIIAGEAEKALVKLVGALRSGDSYEGIAGVGFKKGKNLCLNPPGKNDDFQSLPLADLSDLDPQRYTLGKQPLCFITTTRGCPHRCSFCSVHRTFTEGFTRRDPEAVFQEMEKRFEQGYRVFDFEDDNLTFHKKDFTRLLQLIIDRWAPGKIRLLAMNGVSTLSLDREVLSLMRQAGFSDLNLSLVSADKESLAKVNRPHTPEKFEAVVKEAHELGFRIVAYQIIGLPFESLEKMIQTMATLARLPVLIGASIFYLAPGSPMAREVGTPGEVDCFKARSTAMAVESPRFARDDLYTLFITARILNFLKGLRVENNGVSLKEALQSAGENKRGRTGADLLTRLLEENQLYAAISQGLKPLPRFRTGLFRKVLNETNTVGTMEGREILVGTWHPQQKQ